MTTNQEARQASVRGVTSTTHPREGDWHALWDAENVAAGTFNERMLAYVNAKLGASYTNVGEAMHALAVDQGFGSYSAMATFTPGVP